MANPNVSEEAKGRSKQALDEMESRGELPEQQRRDDEGKNAGNVVGGHKVRAPCQCLGWISADVHTGHVEEPERFGGGKGAFQTSLGGHGCLTASGAYDRGSVG